MFCWNLFHFDIPWNPARLEQRNGRIDRKLQKAPVVYCRYFLYENREEDTILRRIVEKTETIYRELGGFGTVLDKDLIQTLRRRGIERAKGWPRRPQMFDFSRPGRGGPSTFELALTGPGAHRGCNEDEDRAEVETGDRKAPSGD